ncbi:MAG: hypothetical protein ACWGMY_00650 [Hyphomicrobiaceae bacterium]|jgi:opacity protein-like surface antigen
MNFKIATALAGVVLAASAVPAVAQDYRYGGGSIKDIGRYAGVPVPAPVPFPVYKADYYIRGDFGVGLTDTMSVSEESVLYGQPLIPGSWVADDGNLPMTFGFGAGRYWSDHFRTDVTIEWVRQQKGVIEGTGPLASIGTLTVHDETTKESGVFMANAYFDFGRGETRRFTPYIGAGIGFAINWLDRSNASSLDDGFSTYEYSAQNKSTTVTLAAAAMVGFTYDLGHSTLLDVNYRFLHIGGSDISLGYEGLRSSVSFDAQNEHQIRAGLRFNID